MDQMPLIPEHFDEPDPPEGQLWHSTGGPFGEYYIAISEAAFNWCKQWREGIPCWTPIELDRLKDAPPEVIRAATATKRVFPGSWVVRTSPHNAAPEGEDKTPCMQPPPPPPSSEWEEVI